MATLKIESSEDLGLKFGEDCRIEFYDGFGNPSKSIHGECELVLIKQNAAEQSFVYDIDVSTYEN